jgi:hypothetical protein
MQIPIKALNVAERLAAKTPRDAKRWRDRLATSASLGALAANPRTVT